MKLIEPFTKLGIELEVRNAAIAGIGSFSFGWCFKNALGEDVDVVSWDPEVVTRGDNTAAFEDCNVDGTFSNDDCERVCLH